MEKWQVTWDQDHQRRDDGVDVSGHRNAAAFRVSFEAARELET